MRKNDMVTVMIEDMGSNGEGIGKIDGYALFIKDAVIGDVVEAKITELDYEKKRASLSIKALLAEREAAEEAENAAMETVEE